MILVGEPGSTITGDTDEFLRLGIGNRIILQGPANATANATASPSLLAFTKDASRSGMCWSFVSVVLSAVTVAVL